MTEESLDLFYGHPFVNGLSRKGATEFMWMYFVLVNMLPEVAKSDFNPTYGKSCIRC